MGLLQIKPFEEIYLAEMAGLYIESYDPNEIDWDLSSAQLFLKTMVDNNQQYCFEAIMDNKCVGAIFVAKGIPCKNTYLSIESVQVYENYHDKGIGSQLLTALVNKAKSDGVFGIHFLIDKGKRSLKTWYKKAGAISTQAVEYAIYLK